MGAVFLPPLYSLVLTVGVSLAKERSDGCNQELSLPSLSEQSRGERWKIGGKQRGTVFYRWEAEEGWGKVESRRVSSPFPYSSLPSFI